MEMRLPYPWYFPLLVAFLAYLFVLGAMTLTAKTAGKLFNRIRASPAKPAKRPSLITALAVFRFLIIFYGIINLPMSLRLLPRWYWGIFPFLLIPANFMASRELWRMKKWSLFWVFLTALGAQLVSFLAGKWWPLDLVVFADALIVLFYWRKMEKI